jgi:hypothetical protein
MSNKETQGEDLIADFLDEKDIGFKRHKKIRNLKGDNHDFREADFYLTEKKVYLEFLGKWNSGEDHIKRYKQKMAIYHRNKIPCVYIWPDNLGTLDWIINRRITEIYLKYGLKKELFIHEFNNFIIKNMSWIIFFIVLIAFFKLNPVFITIILGIILCGLFYRIFQRVKIIEKIKKSRWVSP